MKNGEKYKTFETREKALADFCKTKIRKGCENCKAHHPTVRNCVSNWLDIECEEETPSADARLEREKRVQEVALRLVARTSADVAYAFQLSEEYIAECERREKVIKEEVQNER